MIFFALRYRAAILCYIFTIYACARRMINDINSLGHENVVNFAYSRTYDIYLNNFCMRVILNFMIYS